MVYEFFYFHDELDILDIKLHEAGDEVDKFVVIECETDCTGRPKPLYFELHKNRFANFLHKIIYIRADPIIVEGVNTVRTRLAECYKGFKDCKPDDILVFTDPDVVLRRSIYKEIKECDMENHEVQLICNWYFYYMNGLFIKEKFVNCTAFLYKNTVDSEWGTVTRWKPVKTALTNAGWHFSKLGGAKVLAEHIDGYPHGHCDYPNMIGMAATIKLLQRRITNGLCWEGGYPGQKVVNYIPYRPDYFPQYVNEHPEIYAKYFKGGMK